LQNDEPEPMSDSPAIGVSAFGVEYFRILNESTGQVDIVSVRDYVRGAVVAEMPASFHPEALKAQAVAAHTFALHNHLRQQSNPDPALMGADFSADPQNRWGYMTQEMAMAFLQPNPEIHWAAITSAVDRVLHYIVEHDDLPILAAYHAMSAGRTEYASNVWVGSAPYLLAVESIGDFLAPNFETTVSVSRQQAQSSISANHPAADLSGDMYSWIRVLERSGSGYVLEADVGGLQLHGRYIREMFGLRSHNFDVQYNGDQLRFAVFGHGHGVGLSQYGADFLARQGYTFDQILMLYYPGTQLRRVRADLSL